MKFTIFKNMHYSLPFFIAPHFNLNTVRFEDVRFSKTCWYQREQVEFTGVNKLGGIGFGLNHQKNSIRIGWQPNFEKEGLIDIWVYWYDQDHEGYQKKHLFVAEVGRPFDIEIEINEYDYFVSAYSNCTTFNATAPKTHGKTWGFWLKPYFGGKSRAPLTMKINFNPKT